MAPPATAQAGMFMEKSENLRICYFIDSLRRDGAQNILAKLTNGLVSRGYDQRVYCLNDARSPSMVIKITDGGTDVVTIGKVKLLTTIGLLKIFIDLKKWSPHVVVTFLPFAHIIGRTLAGLAAVPFVVSSIRQRNVDAWFGYYTLSRLTARWADKVVFNSRDVIEFALANEGVREHQVCYIPNGVEILPEPSGERSIRVRRKLGIGASTRVIGTVGRLYPQKGLIYLLQAFAKVAPRVDDTILLIVGEGPLLQDLKGEARDLGVHDKVRFLGERSDVPELLNAFDVYVQSSLFEGMPNAVMEALAAARLVAATQVDGISELIEHGTNGLLVPPGDSEALAEAIIYALENQAKAMRMGAAAKLRMGTDFSVDKMVGRFDSLFRGLIGASRQACWINSGYD